MPIKAMAVGFICLLHLSAAPQNVAADRKGLGEYEVKAAYLYNFAKYVKWPKGEADEDPGLVRLGILGKDPFGAILKEFEGSLVQGKSLIIYRSADLKELFSVQMLYLSPSLGAKHRALLHALEGRPVLTVSDAPDFLKNGGMIQLFEQNRKIRFAINPLAAEAVGLDISSRLLKLAVIYRQAP